jgi:hypothetical protein
MTTAFMPRRWEGAGDRDRAIRNVWYVAMSRYLAV